MVKKSKRTSKSRKSIKKVKQDLNIQNKKGKVSGLSIAAFSFSLLGLLFSWSLEMGWALNLVAIIFAISSLKGKSRGLSLVSLIIGIIGLLLWLILFIFRKSFIF